MNNYRDPPPYPGHSKQVFSNQPGFRQSFSGSETSTDVSLSSTENLATLQRQEPQGEETQSPFYGHLDFGGVDGGSSYSILARLGMPPGGLDILGKQQQQQHSTNVISSSTAGLTSSGSNLSASPGSQMERYHHSKSFHQQQQQHQHQLYNTGSPKDVLRGISANESPSFSMPSSANSSLTSSSSSVPSPLYSQGHLTVPHWQLGSTQGHGPSGGSVTPPLPPHSQHHGPGGRTGQHYSAGSASSPASSPSISFSRNNPPTDSLSPSSTLSMTRRMAHGGSTGKISGGGNTAGDYATSSSSSSSSSSHVSSSSALSSTSWSVTPRASGGTVTTSAQKLPPARMAEYASTPSSWSSSGHQYMSPRVPPISTYHHPHPYVNTHFTVGSGDSTSSSHSSSAATPTVYNSESSGNVSNNGKNVVASGVGEVLQHQHQQQLQLHQYQQQQRQQQAPHQQLSHSDERLHSGSYSSKILPPPPQYPKSTLHDTSQTTMPTADKLVGGEIRTCRSFEMFDQGEARGGSRPDLRLCASSPGICNISDLTKFSSQSPARSSNTSCDDSDQVSIAARASHMVEMLTDENRALREELASFTVKVAKLLKFEMEIQKVHDSHEALLQSHQKREALWVAMKRKLEERIQALETGSRMADGVTGKTATSAVETELRNKLAEKDALVSRLLSQNQELSTNSRQLESENSQLVVNVAEQKAHVEILENALVNTQAKVLALDEEQRQKQASADKVEQLQGALTSLQQASEKQEQREREMRQRLEKELEGYKTGGGKKLEPAKEDEKSVSMLRKMLHEKDARILQLETEIAGLEQKYVKEATLRQLKMDDSPQPFKEVRMAALEKSSSDMEKLIDEAKTEKLKHMEELHQSNRKTAELEAKVKQLQTQLVEKEAMVKLFQRSPLSLPRSSSLHALYHSPMHSPRPSLIASQATEASPGAGSYRDMATVRHMKTESSSAIELGRKMSMEEDLLAKVQNLNTESKSDSEEEVKLWHV